MIIGAFLLSVPFVFPLGSSRFVVTFGLTLLYIGSTFLLIAALVTSVPERATAKALALVGSHSYSIYLWHQPIGQWAVPKLNHLIGTEQNWFFYTAAYMIGSVLFGIFMASLIEFPVLRLRDHLFPSRGRPLTVSLPKPLEQTASLSVGANEGDMISMEKPAAQPSCVIPGMPDGSTPRTAVRSPEH